MTTPLPNLEPEIAYVWRARLRDAAIAERLRPLLSDEEQARADRFFTHELRDRYTIAHGRMRWALSHYAGVTPRELAFVEGEHGKPSLAGPAARCGIHFNLSHSSDIALIAMSRDGPIGVDVERWDAQTDHLELAEHFFSPAERKALRSLAGDRRALVAGFFAAWTRKEAYLKATGHGITRGLHHFDVSLLPDAPAQLVADRTDARAPRDWTLAALAVGEGFSGAVAARSPLRHAVLMDVE